MEHLIDKLNNGKFYSIVSTIFIIMTGAINLFGYFKLPDTIATQFSFHGGSVNHMPKSIYLIASFFLILLITVFLVKGEKQQKLKYFITDLILVIANTVMIVIQL
ncbi:MAG: hypothetical protein K0S47_3426 [Herbinix sp.]|jgi:uncharacterized membrane protein|nr:hypothetical protein [Herbinix sp.]